MKKFTEEERVARLWEVTNEIHRLQRKALRTDGKQPLYDQISRMRDEVYFLQMNTLADITDYYNPPALDETVPLEQVVAAP